MTPASPPRRTSDAWPGRASLMRFRSASQVGIQSHGFSMWKGKVVMLSSEEGTVILVDLAKAEARWAYSSFRRNSRSPPRR